MSNVRIEAIGDVGLEVEVILGPTTRATHSIAAGEVAELAVGGGQKLSVAESKAAAPTAEVTIDEGADVNPEPEAEVETEEGGAEVVGDYEADAALDVPSEEDMFPTTGNPVE